MSTGVLSSLNLAAIKTQLAFNNLFAADPTPAPSGGSGGLGVTITPTAPPGVGAKVSMLLNVLSWGALIVCVIGIIVQFARMAIHNNRPGESTEMAFGIGWAFVAGAGIASVVQLVNWIWF